MLKTNFQNNLKKIKLDMTKIFKKKQVVNLKEYSPEAIAKQVDEYLESKAFKKLHGKIDETVYGWEKKKDYFQKLYRLEFTYDFCRRNGYLTRADWKEQNVPMNKLFKDVAESAIKYSEVLKYFAKRQLDEERHARGFK